jgi:hypothetical protein
MLVNKVRVQDAHQLYLQKHYQELLEKIEVNIQSCEGEIQTLETLVQAACLKQLANAEAAGVSPQAFAQVWSTFPMEATILNLEEDAEFPTKLYEHCIQHWSDEKVSPLELACVCHYMSEDWASGRFFTMNQHLATLQTILTQAAPLLLQWMDQLPSGHDPSLASSSASSSEDIVQLRRQLEQFPLTWQDIRDLSLIVRGWSRR